VEPSFVRANAGVTPAESEKLATVTHRQKKKCLPVVGGGTWDDGLSVSFSIRLPHQERTGSVDPFSSACTRRCLRM